MAMGLFVPSMGRATTKFVQAGPLADMPEELRERVTYVVPEDEVDDYSEVLAGEAEVVGCPERGIAATRQWIAQYAATLGYTKISMMDDDIRFLVRRHDQTWQLRGTEYDEVVALLATIESLLDVYGHVGVSAREGNNRAGEGPAPLVQENTRTLRHLSYRIDDFLLCEHGRVAVMEDFDVNLQLLRRGIPNANICYWAQGQKMTGMEGGCSLYRTHEVHEASARRLAELHPGLVSLRDKQNKGGGEFGTRKEVTIQWKRAYGHG